MPQRIDANLKEQLLSQSFRPAITLWNRLEGRAREENFERSLRAEIRDPLWMLTRQWQVGEFKGEDAGSAAKARVQLDTARIDRYAARSQESGPDGSPRFQPAVPYAPELPLEVEVEREALWNDGAQLMDTQIALRGQLGRHWLRMLRAAGLAALKPAFLDEFAFVEIDAAAAQTPEEQLQVAHVQSDPAAWQVLRAFKGRVPDGRRLLRAIDDGSFDVWVDSRFDAAIRAVLEDLARDFRRAFDRLYSQPQSATEDAWAPPYLEYQFAVSAPADAAPEQRAVLVAEGYHQGSLDWYSFESDPQRTLADAPDGSFDGASFETQPPVAVVPTQIEYNGMPSPRWWQLEDRRTNFGGINAATTDVPLLLLAEFGLIYGNDWFVVPYNLPVGTLARINGLVVTDVFGVRTLIRAAASARGMEWQDWSMYTLTSRTGGPPDPRLLLAPAVAKALHGDPLEKVIVARDEIANMVWGVEERIPGALGTGVDGFEAATALSQYFRERAAPSTTAPEPSNASIRYVLGTTVPENWIPFMATRKPGSARLIRLQRAAMPRLTDAIADSRVEPRGAILRAGLDGAGPKRPYFVHQEEAPRRGAIVTREFQRTRWFDGRVYTWIGRRKQTGRGPGASGLAFDRVPPLRR